MKFWNIVLLIAVLAFLGWLLLSRESNDATDIEQAATTTEPAAQAIPKQLFQDTDLGVMFQYPGEYCLNGPEFSGSDNITNLDIVYDPCPSNQIAGSLYLDAKVAMLEIVSVEGTLDEYIEDYLVEKPASAKNAPITTKQGLTGQVYTWGKVDGNDDESYNEGFKTSTRIYFLELKPGRVLTARVFDGPKWDEILPTLTSIGADQ